MAEHPLDGMREKLKRADQCIDNLNAEIIDFLAPFPTLELPLLRGGVHPGFTDEHKKAWKEFGRELLERAKAGVPLRIGVLAGEIIHHLRSCFDHLMWQLSDETLRNTGNNAYSIDFPVFETDPALDKKKSAQYKRKIQFVISRPEALARIDRLQPHRAPKPFHHPLWLIHEMDRIDKHRELTIVVCNPGFRIEGIFARAEVPVYKAGVPVGVIPVSESFGVDVSTRFAAYVAFNHASDTEVEAAIPFLTKLYHFTVDTIELFAGDF